MSRTKSKRPKDEDYLALVAKDIKNTTLVSEMREERIIPTVLTSYNRATGVGGHPLGCVVLVHGPEQVGKSALAIAILESIRKFGRHPVHIWDSEFAAEKKWYGSISPGSGFKMTASLDEVASDIQSMIDNLQKGKTAGKIPADVGCGFLLDTLKELLPDSVLEKIKKEGPEKSYPIQALFVSNWVKSVIEDLYRSGSTMVIVLQERVKMNAKPFERDYNVTGGRSVQYANRMRARVYYARKVRVDEKKDGDVCGMECRYTIENNKIVGTTFERGIFFTANGKESGTPLGLDLVREAYHEAKYRGWVAASGKSVVISSGKKTLLKTKHGTAGALKVLKKDDEKLMTLVDALNKVKGKK